MSDVSECFDVYVVVVASVRALFPNCSQNGKIFLRGTDLFPDQSESKISNNIIGLAVSSI